MDKKTYEDKSFWVALGLIAILSTIVILISAEDGTLPTGALVSSTERQHIFFLPAGKIAYIQVREIPGLDIIELTAEKDIKDVDVILSAEEIPFQGIPHSSFTIRSVPEAAFSMKLIIKIQPKELDALRVEAEEVRLFANGREIPLAREGSTEKYLTYMAQTSELGAFVIGKPSLPLAPPPLEIQDSIQEPPAQTIPVSQPIQPVPKLSFWERLKGLFS